MVVWGWDVRPAAWRPEGLGWITQSRPVACVLARVCRRTLRRANHAPAVRDAATATGTSQKLERESSRSQVRPPEGRERDLRCPPDR